MPNQIFCQWYKNNDNFQRYFSNICSILLYSLQSTCSNTKIYEVIITDADYGVNAKIKYKLENEADNSYFAIDESGNVTLTKQLDYEKKPLYQVRSL